jgi:hypothetical protein
MSQQRRLVCILFCVAALVGLPSTVPAQEEAEILYVALPSDVFVVVGESLVLITGRPTSTSPVSCAPGTAQAVSAVVVDEGGSNGAEQTGVLVFHETPPRPGTRIRIVGGPYACSTDLRLYEGVVE